MSELKDGGPAFPAMKEAHAQEEISAAAYNARLIPGMSLRDYLAAKAISVVRPLYSVTSKPHKLDGEQLPPFSKIRADAIAREAYEVADAMIAEREKEVNPQLPPGLQEKPKFKEGDKVRVWVRDSTSSNCYHGEVGTVDLAVNEPIRGWCYRVSLNMGIAGKVDVFPENCLEAAGEGER